MRKTQNNNTLGIGIVTPLYDSVVNVIGWGTNFQKRLVRLSRLESNDSLVDIGAGTGTFCICAKKFRRASKIVGIDPDRHILDIAKQKTVKENLKIEYINTTAQDLPFKNNSLDIVVSSLAFHHMSTADKKRACKEIYRVLKHDGHFLLADFGPSKNIFVKLLISFGGMLGFENKDYAKDNLKGFLPMYMEEAGFNVKDQAPMKNGVQFLLGTK
jgi:ubiquinone/menaquinone biosynthesis C-methylase UbiE